MKTNAPIRTACDLMLELILGLECVQAAAEVIAADAGFNMRMADLQGRSSPQVFLGAMKRCFQLHEEMGRACALFLQAAPLPPALAPESEEMQKQLLLNLKAWRKTFDDLVPTASKI